MDVAALRGVRVEVVLSVPAAGLRPGVHRVEVRLTPDTGGEAIVEPTRFFVPSRR